MLEHALTPAKLLVGKALAFVGDATTAEAGELCAQAIADGRLLHDPLELRPLPLSGMPNWHHESGHEAFHLATPCYQPRRAGREYPGPMPL